jgi:NADH:ubiquinone oxidoreductase subunit 5 (subunit L)/multisubunit Na+/H+ antiporter MnhA subunit
MNEPIKSAWKGFLRGIAWLFFGIGGLSFWAGGKAISEFANRDRGIGELEGIGIAVVCFALGALAKSAGEEDVSEEEGRSSA